MFWEKHVESINLTNILNLFKLDKHILCLGLKKVVHKYDAPNYP